MPYPSLIKVPHLSSASHFDLYFIVSLEAIYLPRSSLLVLSWWEELLLLFLHHLHGSNFESCPQKCFCLGAQGSHEGRGRAETISHPHAAVLGVHRQMACQHHPTMRKSNEPCSGSCWLCSSSELQIVLKKKKCVQCKGIFYIHPLLGGLRLLCIHGSSLQTGLGLGPSFDNISHWLARSHVSHRPLFQAPVADTSPKSIHLQCTYPKGNVAFI